MIRLVAQSTTYSMPEMSGDGPQRFNNADSFAQAFDEAWAEITGSNQASDRDAHLALVMERVAEHPFRLSSPELADQVAQFRLRLLGL